MVRFDPPAGGAPDVSASPDGAQSGVGASAAVVPEAYALSGGTQPGELLAILPTDSSYPIATLKGVPIGSFFLRVHSVVAGQLNGTSNEFMLHNTTTVTPSAPANLLGLADGSALTLAWRNTFTGGIPTNSLLRVTGAANLALPLGPSETFSFPAVPPGTYTFAVINANGGGQSPSSSPVTLTFPASCSGPPQSPEDFLLYVNNRILGAIWELPKNGPAPNGYVLDVASPIFTGRVPIRGTDLRNIPVPPGSYTMRVIATSSCGESAPTATQTVVVQ
jgi:hypothetical protein